jgi:hypothetical protein
MFKRIIKIILILLAVFLLVLGIIWLIGRHNAEKAGTKTLSFKQFIGLSSKESSTGNGNGSGALSSNFGNNGSGNGNGSGSGNGSNNNGSGSGNGSNNNGEQSWSGVTNTSDFTNGGITPSGNSAGNGNGVANTGPTNNGSGNNSNVSDTGNDSGDTGTIAPTCGTADTNITFTADELTELNNLQNQFYTLAQTLHTDADVATELANHDAFALKADQVTELYNYCESKITTAPFATSTQLQRRVATPFWDAWDLSWNPTTYASTTITPAPDSRAFFDVTAYCSGDPTCISHIESSGGLESDSSSSCGGPLSPGYNSCIQVQNLQSSTGIQQGSSTLGLLDFSNPTTVPITGSALGDTGILIPVIDRILRVNIW